MTTIRLWYIEFCDSDIGIWDKKWFLNEEKANNEFAFMLRNGYKHDEDAGGERGDLLGPYFDDVELTPEGVLRFANEYAVDTGNC